MMAVRKEDLGRFFLAGAVQLARKTLGSYILLSH